MKSDCTVPLDCKDLLMKTYKLADKICTFHLSEAIGSRPKHIILEIKPSTTS